MFAVSQIIERNLHRRKPGGTALWINPERDDCWLAVKQGCSSLKLFSQDYGCYAFLRQMGANTEFAALPGKKDNRFEWIIINLPRQKALLNMVLDCASTLLAPGGILWLAGENKAGIKSSGEVKVKADADEEPVEVTVKDVPDDGATAPIVVGEHKAVQNLLRKVRSSRG